MTAERLPLPLRPALLTFALFAPRAGANDLPSVGTVRELPVVSVSLSVGSLGRECKRVVYAPPPGWYVRSHRVQATNRSGTVAYSVSTVPAGWQWVNDERAAASGRAAGSIGLTLPTGLPANGQASGSQESAVAGRQSSTSSHHVLVVDVTARGSGLWQGGGGVDLTVFAEMVYLGR